MVIDIIYAVVIMPLGLAILAVGLVTAVLAVIELARDFLEGLNGD